MDRVDTIIGEEGVLGNQLELSHAEKLTILTRQKSGVVRGSEEFRAEVRLHSVLKHRVFAEVVKRYKPQIVIDVYGGSILYVGEESNRKAIPEKNVEVGTVGRVLSLTEPSLQKYIINDRRYDHSDLEVPKKFGQTVLHATKYDISLDDMPTHLRRWKTQHIRDEHTQVLILVDPYEAVTQKQLKSLFALRAELSHAAFLIFTKFTAANAVPPRTQLQPKKGETDMPGSCLRQCFLDSQIIYTLYSFGISNTMWKESIETAFGGKGTISHFKDVGLTLFEKRVDDLKTKLQDPVYRPVIKSKWELEIKQISESILKPSSHQHQEPVLCACEFHIEPLNLVIPLCLYAVVFGNHRKIFNIKNINNHDNCKKKNGSHLKENEKSRNRKLSKNARTDQNGGMHSSVKKRKCNSIHQREVQSFSDPAHFASAGPSSPVPQQQQKRNLSSKKIKRKKLKLFAS